LVFGRVLFVASVYSHIAHFHKPFIQLLQSKGYEIHVAATGNINRKKELEELGVVLWDIPFARSPYSLNNIQAYLAMQDIIRKNDYDLIHVHTPVSAFLVRYLASINKVPVLYTAHGFHFFKGAPLHYWLIYNTAERIARKWTDGLIVMNNEDYLNAQKLGFQPEQDLFFVHGVGVDINKYIASDQYVVRKELNIPESAIVVICVAELNKNKNQWFLLDAWKRICKKYSNCYLLLVGNGPERIKLEKYVLSGQIPRIHFLGYRKDIPQLLHESDILTLVSKREGLPRCIMEAMAAFKPVVATSVRGSRDLVYNGESGYLVPLGDMDELVSALEMLFKDQSLRLHMGATGRKMVEKYSIEKVISEMELIYSRYLKF
jgi:glycosyltransferase involved in cell wall biosynthesis